MNRPTSEEIGPEVALLLAGARPRLDTEARQHVAECLGQEIDWTYLIDGAIRHHVDPLLHRALAETAPELVPPEILEAFRIRFERQAERNRLLVRELLDLLDALDRSGIPVIPFKGPLLACRAYGNLSLRRFRDLDFLVRERDATAALEVLAARGYAVPPARTPAQDAAFRRYAGQCILFRDGGEVGIEPHWAFAPGTMAIGIDYAALWRRAVRTSFDGVPIHEPAPEDLLLILCLHGLKEHWARLKWVCDVAAFVRARPDLDWDAAFGRAGAQGCARMLRVGLRLAGSLLEEPLPPDVEARIAADRTALSLAEQMRRRILRERFETPNPYRVSRFVLRTHERLRGKASYLLRTVATPRRTHFDLVALPDALFAGYYPIKLVHDYLLLPAWLAAKRLRGRRQGKTA